MRWTAQRLLFLGLILAVSLILGACGASPTSSTRARPVTIGFLADLTGANPAEGQMEKAVTNLAITRINSHGGIDGRPLKVIYADDQVLPNVTVTQLQNLVASHVAAVVGISTSTMFAAACPVAERDHMVLLSPITTGEGLTNGKTYCFRNAYQTGTMAPVMMKEVKVLGYTRVAIATDTTAYGLDLQAGFEAGARELGIHVTTVQEWTAPATNLTAQVLAIKRTDPQAVVLGPALGPDAALFAETMVQNGLKVPLIGTGGISSAGSIKPGAPYFSALPFVMDISTYDPTIPAEATFTREIEHTLGFAVGGGGPTRVYTGIELLAQALRKTKGQGGLALAKAMSGICHFPSLSGGPGSYVDFCANHSSLFGRPIVFFKWSPTAKNFVYLRLMPGSISASGKLAG